MIEHLEEPRIMPATQALASGGRAPAVMLSERAYLSCNCTMAVGHRLDTMEPAIAAFACSDDHREMMHVVVKRYQDSLSNPTDLPAVQVAEEILQAEALIRNLA